MAVVVSWQGGRGEGNVRGGKRGCNQGGKGVGGGGGGKTKGGVNRVNREENGGG